jgi:hypothetical protein
MPSLAPLPVRQLVQRLARSSAKLVWVQLWRLLMAQ